MSDYEVNLVNDNMQEFYVRFYGPAESMYLSSLGVRCFKLINPQHHLRVVFGVSTWNYLTSILTSRLASAS